MLEALFAITMLVGFMFISRIFFKHKEVIVDHSWYVLSTILMFPIALWAICSITYVDPQTVHVIGIIAIITGILCLLFLIIAAKEMGISNAFQAIAVVLISFSMACGVVLLIVAIANFIQRLKSRKD